jgi:hypothetical protein
MNVAPSQPFYLIGKFPCKIASVQYTISIIIQKVDIFFKKISENICICKAKLMKIFILYSI